VLPFIVAAQKQTRSIPCAPNPAELRTKRTEALGLLGMGCCMETLSTPLLCCTSPSEAAGEPRAMAAREAAGLLLADRLS